jgi:hypothetical protein
VDARETGLELPKLLDLRGFDGFSDFGSDREYLATGRFRRMLKDLRTFAWSQLEVLGLALESGLLV